MFCLGFTTGGNGGGKPCWFPFLFKRMEVDECITPVSTTPWCATTANYNRDKQYGYCKVGGMLPWWSCRYCKLKILSNESNTFTTALSRLGVRADPNAHTHAHSHTNARTHAHTCTHAQTMDGISSLLSIAKPSLFQFVRKLLFTKHEYLLSRECPHT